MTPEQKKRLRRVGPGGGLSLITRSGGPPPTYTISGTITGDEVEGVTVALTGDATDSVVTGAAGTFAFEGLAPGNYTVTPTLTDYTFTPAATSTEIVDEDYTTADFVSTLITYAISGAITGDEVEGVTVALTGDATDSMVTGADGLYEFTGLVDGSYTVTPTLTDYTFTPASSAVEVSGGDETADFVSEYDYLILPYTYDVTTEATGGSNGDLMSSLDSKWIDRTLYEKFKMTENALADPQPTTPTGVTRHAYAYGPDGGATAEYGRIVLPHPIDPVGIIRVACLMRTTISYRGGLFLSLQYDDDAASWSSLAYFQIGKSTDSPPKAFLSTLHYSGGTGANEIEWVDMSSSGAGGAISTGDARYWMWLGAELNYTAETVTARVWRPYDASNKYSYLTQAMNAQGKTKDLCQPFNVIQFAQTASDADLYVFVPRVWIGTGDDAWPT